MNLYTLLIDFDGGTYVSQAPARNFHEAPEKCIEKWEIDDMKETISGGDKHVILEQLKEEEFVLVKGMKGVWCGGVCVRDKYCMLHLVCTQSN